MITTFDQLADVLKIEMTRHPLFRILNVPKDGFRVMFGGMETDYDYPIDITVSQEFYELAKHLHISTTEHGGLFDTKKFYHILSCDFAS